jgi:serine/threonine-protein kinase
MADDLKRIAPSPPTPAPGAQESGQTPARLPDEIVREQMDRLALFAAVIGGLWAIALFVDIVLAPLAWDTGASPYAILLEIGGVGAAALMVWFARYCPRPPRAKVDISLAYLVVNGIAVAILNTWIVPPPAGQAIHLSWITVGILIFSMIAPASPRKMLAAALVTASMDPLALWIAHLLGNPVVSLPQAVIMVWPNYVCAVVAVLPSRVLHRLGRRLREAQELGSYTLVERLGHGGMGEVWRAHHGLLARSAAVKLVRPEVLGARNEAEVRVMLRRFEREARATAALNSPHTIQVFDFGRTNEGTFYYVMELLVGCDLETLVREFGPIPSDRVVFLLRQVCHSLADAHARGMVHRDIKPANIYVCRMGLDYDFVKVLDFGLVKLRERGPVPDTLLTLDQTTTGTPAYMAPEIILGDGDVDRRADVYALGCVAYYMLTGQLVFEAETPMKMLMQHVHAQPVPPSQRTEMPVPRELDELILACLEKDPARRPQNAEELFRMAQACKVCDTWNHASAGLWWQVHLPHLTGPLPGTVAEERPEPIVVAH